MLKLLEIRGFRSFSQESFQKIEMQPFTVIVGENDTGKSNVLKAVQFALDPSAENITKEDFNIRKSRLRSGKIGDKKASQITIKLHFTDRHKLLPRKYQRKSYHRNGDSFVIKCVVSGHDKNSYKKKYSLNEKKIGGGSVGLLLSRIKCFITPSIRDVNHLNELKEILPIETRAGITQAVKNIRSVVKQKMKKQEALIKEATDSEKAVIDPILQSEEVLKILDFDFSIIKDGIPIHLKSHGQGMISKIILSMFLKRGRKFLVGIEEPEIHLHPNLMREMISDCEKMTKKGTQIIIVTHSPYFLNFISTKNILVCRKYNKYTKVYPLTSFPPEIATKIEGDIFLNRQKTEILFAKGAILVEGPYDRRVFTAIDSKEKIRIFEDGISLIDVGGCGSFAIYIELCLKSEIPWVIIGDKTAFCSQTNRKGPVLEAIECYVDDQTVTNLINKIRTNKACKKELKAINDQLKNKKGAIFNLSGDDISATIVAILKKKNDNILYKTLYMQFGGSDRESDIAKIKNSVEDTIKRRKDEMVQAVQSINKPNELERVLKHAKRTLV